MQPASRSPGGGASWHAIAALVLGGCYWPAGGEGEAAPVDLEAEVSPQEGQQVLGGVRADVPLHGFTGYPDEEVAVWVYDLAISDWTLLATTRTAPAASGAISGAAAYAFDLGTACVQGCDVTLPLHAWQGIGPFVAFFAFHSEHDGWLLHPQQETHCFTPTPDLCSDASEDPIAITSVVSLRVPDAAEGS